MCGIAGIVNLEGVNTLELHKMSAVLQHRGPDDEGFLLLDAKNKIQYLNGNDTIAQLSGLSHIQDTAYKIQDTKLGLLHRRLSILDLSPAGHQPMGYADGKYQLVFNGEIYNYKELKVELKTMLFCLRYGLQPKRNHFSLAMDVIKDYFTHKLKTKPNRA